MRTRIIAGNWKMHKTGEQASSFVRELKRKTFNISKTEIIVCPPFTALFQVYEIVKESRIKMGAQNVHWQSSGAYTGEISAEMIEKAGCRYVLIGHSERRQYFGETDWSVNKKIKQTLITTSLIPIVCIGETLQHREEGRTREVVESQIIKGFEALSVDQMQRIIIAYEPVWAIGTGITATPEQAEEVHLFIRELIGQVFNRQLAVSIHILYGGSVKPDNINDLLAQQNIDGGLIGGASLDVDSFVTMIKQAEELKN